jgi:protein SCO1/2
MNSVQRILCSSVLAMAALLVGCDHGKPTEPDETAAPELEVLWPAPKFTLTNQYGQPFGSEQLAGKTWIATLFFTQCKGPCPMMAQRLEDIQAATKNPDIVLVSISCDPQNDTVDRLKAYADAHHADPKRWFFLTGAVDDVKRIANDLKLAYEAGPTAETIGHSTKFLLVDAKGRVRGIYSTEDDLSMAKLSQDAPKLAAEK